MQALPLFALACVAIALAIGASWVGGRLHSSRARVVLAAASVAAAPMAWTAVLALADQMLRATEPVSALTFASYVGAAIVVLSVLVLMGAMMPERRVWHAAAGVPIVVVVLASLQPRTTIGGIVTVLLSLTLLAAASVLPRAAALATLDRTRVFVGIFAALTLVMGGAFGAFLGASAMREGALGLAEASREYRVEVIPDFEGSYRILVPFPEASGDADAVAAEWQGHARVAEGTGEVAPIGDRSALEIVARGPIVIQARYLFHASPDLRAGVASYAMGVPLVLQPEDALDGAATVRFLATASNEGIACAERAADASVRALEPLALVEGPLWPEASCAR